MVIVSGLWAQVVVDGRELMANAFAPGTWVNLQTQWRKFTAFCEYCNISQRLPVRADVLVAYTAWLCKIMVSQHTVKNYVNGIKVLHLLQGHKVTGFEDITVKLALKGVARTLRHTTKQATAITPEILLSMLEYLDLTVQLDATYWALFLLSFFLFMRKSNVVPTSLKSFDESKQLLRGDVIGREGVLVVRSKWSKTNQHGERSGSLPLLPINGSPLCPVTAYNNMCALVPGEQGDPAFFHIKGGVRRPVTYSMFQRKIKTLAQAIGCF